MGLTYRIYLDNASPIFGCSKCGTHLATFDAIISEQFQGQHGQAFLFDMVVNITCGKAENREMTTGLHTVKDISCTKCTMLLGWTYVKAYNRDNKYKEGKFILERKLLTEIPSKLFSS